MIPLRDVIPSRTFPFFTITFIILNSLAFLFDRSLTEPAREAFIRTYGVVPARLDLVTVFTSMFLHGGWGHFLGNMLFLWIFGDNVEDRVGHRRFVLFYLLCGVAAVAAHVYMNPLSRIPTIGASGAIAGVMGGYFVLYPNSRVLALVPLVIIWQIVEVPAILFLGFWFLMQFFMMGLTARTGVEGGGIAFWAHITGFLAGMTAIVMLKKPSRNRWRSEL
ncbi:MAG TPA: rhomboid family intramembrane serine protease, partial [Vicinamibacterales bacterium]|nr:rhomboid family intramembrane serine protease [Vicinamibacterales bacterium]